MWLFIFVSFNLCTERKYLSYSLKRWLLHAVPPYLLCCSRQWSCSSGPQSPCSGQLLGSPPCWHRSHPAWAWRSAWSCWMPELPDPVSGLMSRWRLLHSQGEDLKGRKKSLTLPCGAGRFNSHFLLWTTAREVMWSLQFSIQQFILL